MKNVLPGFLKHDLARLSALLALTLVFTGCSSFDRDYQAALRRPIPKDSPAGPWTGRWSSEKDGHHGELHCLVEKAVDETYTARFKARFWKWFTYTTTATLTMEQTKDGRTFFGTAQLPWLAGGEYHYAGRVNQRFYFSEYSCRWDHGTFYMERPKQ